MAQNARRGGGKHEVDLGFRVEVGRVDLAVFASWTLRACGANGSLGPNWPCGTSRAGSTNSTVGTSRASWASRALWPAAGELPLV